jgi:hypothetical protein
MKKLAFSPPRPCFAWPPSPPTRREKDHPLVGRYEGAVLDGTKVMAYDEVGLIKEPFQNWAGGKPELLQLEGKVTLYHYKLPGSARCSRCSATTSPA